MQPSRPTPARRAAAWGPRSAQGHRGRGGRGGYGADALVERARQQLRQADRETEEDAVMDAMDFLVGWCSPHMKLPPEQATPGSRA